MNPLKKLDLKNSQLSESEILATENGQKGAASQKISEKSEEIQDDLMFAKLYEEGTNWEDEQRRRHGEDEHELRKRHLVFLSKITIFWLGLITTVSWLQGFHGLFMFEIKVSPRIYDSLPFILELRDFQLTNPAFIALITTTTATILGLYTIAAIWLYKGARNDKFKRHESKKHKN